MYLVLTVKKGNSGTLYFTKNHFLNFSNLQSWTFTSNVKFKLVVGRSYCPTFKFEDASYSSRL